MRTLLDGLAEATQAAAEVIVDTPGRPRVRTLAEFMAAFDAVQAPAEALLRRRFEDLLPGVKWAGEFDTDLPAGEQCWVVDVLDGAVQYLQGLPQWCVSVTLVAGREPVAAVLHSPGLGETYTAAKGLGAFLNGHPVSPSDKTELAATLVATSQPPFAGEQPIAVSAAGRSLSAVLPAVGAIRNLGPTSWQIADVAAGRLDAFWQYGVDDGNCLGGGLIARESGVVVTDTAGQAWVPGSDSFLAAPAGIHRQLIGLLQSA
jgi:myo-inositol-1(or 4)-monophosphatase